ncbi:MAG: hypothetical protein AB1706_17120 [Pseudomonadota bacterium]
MSWGQIILSFHAAIVNSPKIKEPDPSQQQPDDENVIDLSDADDETLMRYAKEIFSF